jgi:HEAT repeat protein
MKTVKIVVLLVCLLAQTLLGALAQGLAKQKNELKKSVEKAIGDLRGKEQERQKSALIFLRSQKSRALQAVPALFESLGKNSAFEKEIQGLLASMGSAVLPLLLKEFESAKGARQRALIGVLGRLGAKARPALPYLLKNAQDVDRDLRLVITRTLAFIPDREVISGLGVSLKDRDLSVRVAAAKSLGRLKSMSVSRVPDLIRTLAAKDSTLRGAAAKALGEIGSQSKEIEQGLLKLLNDPTARVKVVTLKAFGGLGVTDKVALGAMARALKDQDKGVVLAAINALGELGWQAESLEPQLRDMFKAKRSLRLPLQRALIAVNPRSTKGFFELAAMARREGVDFRRGFAALCGEAGAASRTWSLVSELKTLGLKDPERSVREQSFRSLARMPRQTDSVLRRFLVDQWRKDKDRVFHLALLPALVSHGQRDREVRELLLGSFKTAPKSQKKHIGMAVIALGWRGREALAAELSAADPGRARAAMLAWSAKASVQDMAKALRGPVLKRLGALLKSSVLIDEQLELLSVFYGLGVIEADLTNAIRPFLSEPQDELRLAALRVFALEPVKNQGLLIKALRDPWEEIRCFAIRGLRAARAGLKKERVDALKVIARGAESRQGFLALGALVTLSQGEDERRYRRKLELGLGRSDLGIWDVFGALGEFGRGSIGELGKAWGKLSLRDQSCLGRALGKIGGQLSEAFLLEMLKDSRVLVRRAALEGLGYLKDEQRGRFDKALQLVLKDDHPGLRRRGVELIGKLGSKSLRLSLFKLVAKKESQPVEFLSAVVEAVRTLGRDGIGPLAPFLGQKKGSDWAGQVLAGLEPEHLGTVLGYYKDRSWQVRRAVSVGLGAGPRRYIPSLVLLLRKSRQERMMAREALAFFGEDAIGSLIAEVSRGHPDGLESAALSLSLIGEDSVVPLITLCRSKTVKDRRYGVRALGLLGPLNSRVAAALVSALEDKDTRVRAAACESLGSCVTPAQSELIFSALLEALKDSSRKVRVQAVRSFGRIGESCGAVAAPALRTSLRAWDQDIRRASATALSRLGEEGVKSIPDLMKALKDQAADVRLAVVESLERFGKLAGAAQELLEKMGKEDPDLRVKVSAALAAAKIKASLKK